MGLFGNGGQMRSEPIGMTKSADCKPDYQRAAAEKKKRMDAKQDLFNALEHCLECCYIPHHLAVNQTTLYEVLGALRIETITEAFEYDKLLNLIKKEKADGTK